MLPQGAAVAFVLTEVAVNGAVVERDLVVFAQVGAYLFGAVLLLLVAVSFTFAADGAFVAVQLFGDFGDGAVAGQILDMVSFVLGQLCVALMAIFLAGKAVC